MSKAAAQGVHQRFARAVKKQSEHSAKRHRSVHVATVLSVGPYRVELHDKPHVLTEGVDLLVGQWVKFYDICWGVQPGDNALVDFRHGHYTFSDIISDLIPNPLESKVEWYDVHPD